MIPLFWPSYDGKAIQEAMAEMFPVDMENRWLGQAHLVKRFEEEFGRKFGYKYCVGVNSGTSALDLAYHMCGIGMGDEVITPVLTCTATNLPLIHRGARIVFADISENFTVSYEDIKRKITERTKAIVVVTLGGLSVDERIFKLANEKGLPVIVDAAQSVGVGEKYGDYICYSFQAIKHFTTGDGGMLVVREEENYKRAKRLRWFGIDRESKEKNDWKPYKNREMTMDILEPGYKYHMNDVTAAIGLTALKRTDEWMDHRRELAKMYKEEIKVPVIVGGAYWLAGVLVDNRDEFAEKLKEAGIETNMAHLRNDIFGVFGGERQDLPMMDLMEEKYLYIPLNTSVTLEEARHIIETINGVV